MNTNTLIQFILLISVVSATKPKIIKAITGGLNNRLRQVFSYYNYTQKHNFHLTVIWVTNKECNGFFLDYFEPVTGITFLKPFQVTNTMKQQIQKEEDIQEIYKQYTRDLSVLKPKPFIKTIINHRINILNPKYSCMHIRRTDHSKLAKKRKHYTPEKNFEFFIKQKTQFKEIKFYLATDNKYTYRKYQKILKFKYWPSNSKLFRKTDLLATIVDMFVCANATDGFMGSGWSSFSNTIYFLRKQQLKKQIAQENIKYVVMSTSVGNSVKKTNYNFLLPLTALNWYNMGFLPIVIITTTNKYNLKTYNLKKHLISMVPEVKIHVIEIKETKYLITMAQMSRLFISILLPDLANTNFLYTTDADMMILDNKELLKYTNFENPIKAEKEYSYHSIPLHSNHVILYNSNKTSNQKCIKNINLNCQFMMHSVSMQIKYWRKLFNKYIKKTDFETNIIPILKTFQQGYVEYTRRHGGNNWNTDQKLLTKVIKNTIADVKLELNIHLLDGENTDKTKGLYVNQIVNNYTHISDVHLHGFQIEKHNKWLEYLIQKNENKIITKAKYIKYLNNYKIFDIVITVGPSDHNVIRKQLEYTKKNVKGFRNIYLIASANVEEKLQNIENIIIIHEDIFPFNVTTIPFKNQIVKTQYVGNITRNGWYLQQLFKLYAGITIPNILDNYLVIDSDTFFLKPTYFVNNNNTFLYNYADEYHKHYFEHMKRLDNTLKRQHKDKSGICHHMMFQTKYIKEMFSSVSLKHNNKPFYNIFLDEVTDIHSGASEYEIFFNYMLKMHPDEIQLRKLEFMNTNEITNTSNLDYISVHHYKRTSKI